MMMQNMKDCLKVKEGVYKAGVTVSECHNSSTCHFFFPKTYNYLCKITYLEVTPHKVIRSLPHIFQPVSNWRQAVVLQSLTMKLFFFPLSLAFQLHWVFEFGKPLPFPLVLCFSKSCKWKATDLSCMQTALYKRIMRLKYINWPFHIWSPERTTG